MAAPGFDVEVAEDQTWLKLTYRLPKQVMLVTDIDWRQGVMDEAVAQADKRGLMCVGPVMLGEPQDIEPDAGEVQVGLPEGVRMEDYFRERGVDLALSKGINRDAFMEGFLGGGPVSVDMFQVVAEVALMGSMG
jgi:hypothetical protein